MFRGGTIQLGIIISDPYMESVLQSVSPSVLFYVDNIPVVTLFPQSSVIAG